MIIKKYVITVHTDIVKAYIILAIIPYTFKFSHHCIV